MTEVIFYACDQCGHIERHEVSEDTVHRQGCIECGDTFPEEYADYDKAAAWIEQRKEDRREEGRPELPAVTQ